MNAFHQSQALATRSTWIGWISPFGRRCESSEGRVALSTSGSSSLALSAEVYDTANLKKDLMIVDLRFSSLPSFTASEATFEVCATTGLDLVPIISVCTPDEVVSLASWATKNIYILQSTLTNTNQWGRLLQKTPDHLHLVSLLRLLHVALLRQNLHVDLDRRSP